MTHSSFARRSLLPQLLALCSILISLPALPAAGQTSSFTGLGHLPGGNFQSSAFGVSADGAVVVGASESADGSVEAFRWTSSEGMVGLGDLPGEHFSASRTGSRGTGSGL